MTPRVNHYIDAFYGGLPPEPARLFVTLAHHLKRDGGVLQSWRVKVADTSLTWLLQLHWPREPHDDPVQVLLSPDACWPHCVTQDAAYAVLERGCVFASFNRLDVAHDAPHGERAGPLLDCWPQIECGTLSAWAWALGQSARAIGQIHRSAQVAVIGHSRSGKAALLAAACYPWINAAISHNSGTAGASSLRRVGVGAESLRSLVHEFPHWLGPAMRQDSVRSEHEEEDGEGLWKSIAPRGLFIIQAQDDAWANPEGARYRYEQLRESWAARPHALSLLERRGGHAMGCDDWIAAADFLSGLMRH